MGGDHPDLGVDPELVEHRRRLLGRRDVAAAADHDPDPVRAHAMPPAPVLVRRTDPIGAPASPTGPPWTLTGRGIPSRSKTLEDPDALLVLVADARRPAPGRARDLLP